MKGWFPFKREWLDLQIFQDHKKAKAWLLLLSEVAFKPEIKIIHNTSIPLEIDQYAFTFASLKRVLKTKDESIKWDDKKVKKFIKELHDEGLIKVTYSRVFNVTNSANNNPKSAELFAELFAELNSKNCKKNAEHIIIIKVNDFKELYNNNNKDAEPISEIDKKNAELFAEPIAERSNTLNTKTKERESTYYSSEYKANSSVTKLTQRQEDSRSLDSKNLDSQEEISRLLAANLESQQVLKNKLSDEKGGGLYILKQQEKEIRNKLEIGVDKED